MLLPASAFKTCKVPKAQAESHMIKRLSYLITVTLILAFVFLFSVAEDADNIDWMKDKASETGVGKSPSRMNELDFFQATIEMIVALIVVIAIILALYWLMRKYMRNVSRIGSKGEISILAMKYLSYNKSLAVCRIGKKILVLGITNTSISKLGELDEGESAGLESGKKSGAVRPRSPQVD